MRYLRRFNESLSIYDKSWESFLPEEIWVIKGVDGKHKFKKGNIMLNSDMLQITYDNPEYGIPDTLEFDIYFSMLENENGTDSTFVVNSGNISIDNNLNGFIRLNVDITYGDLMACEFSVDKKEGLKLIQDTTYKSKFDPSNTVFAFDEKSLNQFLLFLNRFNTGIKLSLKDFNFLRDK